MDKQWTIERWLTEWVDQAFATLFPELDLSGINTQVVATSDERFGDYQCNAAMAITKIVKKPPRDIAALVQQSELPECVEKVEIAGPGFINFHLKTDWLAASLEQLREDACYGVPQDGAGKKVIIDYAGPNASKPLHIGHIRSIVIGNALDRLLRFVGYDVTADNHLGDWGTQFGLMILGYQQFVDQQAFEKNAIEELERVYRESYGRTGQDKPFEDRTDAEKEWHQQARDILVKLQQGDEECLRLWTLFIDKSKQDAQRLYDRLGVSFDTERGESFYNNQLPRVISILKEKGLAEESEGAQVVKLEDEKLGVCIIQKSDGGYNYATTDLATVLTRLEEYHPDKIVYVTDERQQLHFRQFFAISEKAGWKTDMAHIWFGLMRLPHATFSTRQGNVIKLEALLDEAEKQAMKIIEGSQTVLTDDQKADVARAIGVGALKYADLSQNPQSLVTFTWEKAMSLEGNSAPYLQYAYARISSVRDKYRTMFPGKDYASYPLLLGEPVERKLAVHLLRFGETVLAATRNYRPNYLADYLYELAQIYSTFYQTVPFLKADEGQRESRVKLCDQVARTLRKGLDLLGIETPDRI